MLAEISGQISSFPKNLHVMDGLDGQWHIRVRCTHKRGYILEAFFVKVPKNGYASTMVSPMQFSSQFRKDEEQYWGWFVPGQLYEVENGDDPSASQLIPRGPTHG